MTPDPDPTRTSPPDPTRSAVGDRPTGSYPDDPTRTAGDRTRTANPPPSDTRAFAGGGPATPPDTPPGFVVERELGRGGMGVVYLARQGGLNRPCALKLILSGDTGSVLRFLAEAEAMAAVRHPNVAEVYQFGEHAGRPFLALEFCPGGDLTATLKAGKLPPADAAKLLLAVADGVAAAHAVGIVHRDLKPHNVLLTATGTPKVTDFGLAKREGGSDLTKTNAIMGTPAYMPPEQAKGETKFVGPPADVWALGVILYEALTGTRPFAGADHWAVLAAVQRGTFPPPRTAAADLPRDLELVCLKCLKVEPHERYPSAADLAADLRNWLDGRPISARPAGLVEQAAKWAKRNRRLAAMAAAVFLTMAVATGVAVGFGLDANEQRQKAVAAMKDANDEKQAAIAARTDLGKTNVQMEQTSAAALLAPFTNHDQESGWGAAFSFHEEIALGRLAAHRDDQVGLYLVEQATNDSLKLLQLRPNAPHLLHAIVGLDRRRRAAVDEVITARLRDPALPGHMKRDIAMTAVLADQWGDPDAIAEALLAAQGKDYSIGKWRWLAEGLAAACERLPPHRGAEMCGKAAGSLVAAMRTRHDAGKSRRSSLDWPDLTAGLSAMSRRLPPEEAAAVCRQAVEMMAAELPELSPRNWFGRRELAHCLATACERLPPDEAATVCRRTAALLIATPRDADNLTDQLGFSVGLAEVCRHLPAEEAVSTLTGGMKGTQSTREWVELAGGLAAACERLPTDRGVESLLAALVACRGTEGTWWARRAIALRLAAVCGALPGNEATGVCETAIALLWADRDRVRSDYAWAALAEGLSALCERLPTVQAAVVCGKVQDLLEGELKAETNNEKREGIARGLAWACGWVPAERAADGYGLAAGVLFPTSENSFGNHWSTSRAGELALLTTANCNEVRAFKAGVRGVLGGATVVIRLSPTLHDSPQDLVDLLKYPFCVKELRRAVLDGLECAYGHPFRDLWEFVAFAEKEHPELDLLTPPKRPERK